jgi:hypothetical protein
MEFVTALQPLPPVRFAIFIVCVGLLWAIILLNRKMRDLSKPNVSAGDLVAPPAPAEGGSIAARWGEVQRHVQSDREREWKFAIIEADKLVDDILKEIGVSGDTLGEKLMNITSSQLSTLDDLWEAHKVRNKLAHDSSFFIRDTEARRVIGLY